MAREITECSYLYVAHQITYEYSLSLPVRKKNPVSYA